ncbi:MAG TPA: helix-turn-helix domain-containing protein [Arenibacter sp.]|nr:helix-turn-helix domain-containing protein [Arenibacter sp.]
MRENKIKYPIDRAAPIMGSIFLLITVMTGMAQETSLSKEMFELHPSDLLLLPYERIMELEDKAYENDDLDRLRKLTDIHIQKAKKEGDPIEMASGYYYRTIIEEPGLAISYSDSIILATSPSNHRDYPTFGYILKAIVYYDLADYQRALHNYIIAYNLAVEKQNLEDQLTCSMAIAAVRNLNGQPHAAADIYTRSLKQLKKEKDFESNYYRDYMLLMYNLSLAHLRLSQLDSSRIYYMAGVNKAISVKDSMEYRDFILVGAQLDYYESNFIRARDTLLKYTDALEGNVKAIKLYYLGKIAQRTGNNDLAIDYFQQIDSIVQVTRMPFDNIKEVYQQLVMHYSFQDDREREIESLENLIYYDSLMATGQKNVIQQATVAYDIPYLKLQRRRAIEQLKSKNIWVISLGTLAGLAILIGVFFYLRAKKTRAKVHRLLEGINSPKPTSPMIKKHPTSVPKEIRDDLLNKLDAFEKSGDYLNKDLDMAQLAQGMETNTTYLSTVINHYKQMSFPNYIKDLKITMAIQMLSRDPELLKYNYQGLAETFGFKTGESFSKAFYGKTGVYPSKVLAELKNLENARHL